MTFDHPIICVYSAVTKEHTGKHNNNCLAMKTLIKIYKKLDDFPFHLEMFYT